MNALDEKHEIDSIESLNLYENHLEELIKESGTLHKINV